MLPPLPDSLGCWLNRLAASECLDTLCDLGCRRSRFRLFPILGESGLELVSQAGKFHEVGVMRERLSEPGLVIPERAFCDPKLFPRGKELSLVGAGQPVEGV